MPVAGMHEAHMPVAAVPNWPLGPRRVERGDRANEVSKEDVRQGHAGSAAAAVAVGPDSVRWWGRLPVLWQPQELLFAAGAVVVAELRRQVSAETGYSCSACVGAAALRPAALAAARCRPLLADAAHRRRPIADPSGDGLRRWGVAAIVSETEFLGRG